MAWINALRSISGIYNGYKIPQGNIGGMIINPAIVGDVITVSTSLNDTDYPDSYRWDASFGCSRGPLLDAFIAHLNDPPITNAHFFEIEVEKPQDAQYYKQTICIYLDYSSSEDVTESYAKFEFTFSISKISRLEYATPTSIPTETVIAIFGGAATVLIDSQGPLIPPAYNYIQDKWLVGFSPFLFYNEQTRETERYWGAYLYAEYENVSWERHFAAYVVGAIKESTLASYFDGFVPEEVEDPNEEEPPEDGPGGGGSGGGDGEHVLPDEPVDFPPLPEIGVASVSWLKLFKMTTNQINEFGEAMIPKTAWQLLQVYFTNPLDAIIGILLIPFDAPTSGSRTPALGDFTWPSAYPIINNEFCILDCGAVNIPPYWDSAFDFSPFTRLQIFLPFIGYRDIDADEIMGAGIHVKYYIDLCTGDCTAMIGRSANPGDFYGPRPIQIIAQYNGNCATRVPTGRISHDNAVTAGMSLLGSAINVGGSIMGAALGQPGNISASQVANQVSGGTMAAVNGFKKEVQRSGNIAAAAGYMGITRPYIIRQVPHQDLPKEYKRLEGYPANKGGTLAQFAGTGLNTVEAMELTGFTGFESEREELLSILRGGVIV